MDAVIVLIILCVAVILFATERFRIDMVSMMILGTLLITRVISPQEAVSGFSNSAVITVAAMFVLSGALRRTGAVKAVGLLMMKSGKYPMVLLLLLMTAVGTTSMFINNTAVIAVFLPIALAAASKRKLSPSKLLIPMSFASQAGGVCTLIGTSTNLLVSSISDRSGLGYFSMFELSYVGLILFALTILYFLFFSSLLLPARHSSKVVENYKLGDYIAELRICCGSPMIGMTIMETDLSTEHEIVVLKILRNDQPLTFHTRRPLQEGDILLAEGSIDDMLYLKDSQKLGLEPEFKFKDEILDSDDKSLVEVMIAPRSRLIGKTLARLEFHRRFQMTALAIRRHEKTIHEKLNSTRLGFGDVLLLQGSNKAIQELEANENFIVLEQVGEGILSKKKARIAMLIFLMVIVLATWGVVSVMTAAILGSLGMLLFQCITIDRAYETIDWSVIFLLAGVLPLGIAMARSGAAETIAGLALESVSGLGPYAVLSMLYLITAVLTAAMSNNATAVLLAPIAISVAMGMGMQPKPFLMGVTFAASTCFTTPVGYQTNAMVYNPGGYRYMDFVKVGIPLNILFWIVTVYLVPKVWPF